MHMNISSGERPRDPVCGMAVRVDAAAAAGLVADHESHTFYFCRQGCLDQFTADPASFTSGHAHVTEPASQGALAIDEGMRRWYESCSCCLSDAYPEVKAALDAEREATGHAVAGPGICEVAEA